MNCTYKIACHIIGNYRRFFARYRFTCSTYTCTLAFPEDTIICMSIINQFMFWAAVRLGALLFDDSDDALREVGVER